MNIISNKVFEIFFVEDFVFTEITFSMEELLNDDSENPFEWQNCIVEKFDTICEMKKGDTIFIETNRDSVNSKGVLLRSK